MDSWTTEWWMDSEYYPGPSEVDPLGDFKNIVVHFGFAFGKQFALLREALGDLSKGKLMVWADEIERFGKAFSEPVTEEKTKLNKPVPNHGPRKGGAFDRRGRRRW